MPIWRTWRVPRLQPKRQIIMIWMLNQTPVIVHSTTKYTATLWSDWKACVTVSTRGRAENLAQNPLLYCLNWNSGLYRGWGFLQCCYVAELLVCTFYALLYFLSVRRGLPQPITVWQNLYLISLQVTSSKRLKYEKERLFNITYTTCGFLL